jgi:molecular chaperone HscB
VEGKQLTRALLDLSRRVHPDYFATAPEDQRELAERASAALNEAYEVLNDDFRRADWLVRSLGGPTDAEERQMPQAFLMEVLEWNEVVEEARGAAEGSAAWSAMLQLTDDLREARKGRLEAIGRMLSPLPERGAATLVDLRRELNAVRYIDRTQDELKTLRLEAALGGA